MKTKLIKVNNEMREMSFEEVLDEFKPMIHAELNSQKSKINRLEEEKEDMFQDGCIWLWKAYNSYDISKKTHFSTHAYMYIKRGVQNITLKNNTQGRKNLQTTSLNASLDSENEEFSLENILCKDDNNSDEIILKEALLFSSKLMTEKEKDMLSFMISEVPTKEIAESLNVTPVLVSQRKNIVKRKLIEGFKEYGYSF